MLFCHNMPQLVRMVWVKLSNHRFYKIIYGSLGLLAMTVHCCHATESLPDPTRPPDAMVGTKPAGDEADTAPPPVPVLQSVLLSATRKVAVISGQPVALGGEFGESRLIKLTPNEAVLRKDGVLQVLKLFPDVEKVDKMEKSERPVPLDEDKSGHRGATQGKKSKR